MTLDVENRKLYFSNEDFVSMDGAAYTWHRIEVIGLDGTGRMAGVNDVEKPRGICIDQGYEFCTNEFRQNGQILD